MVRSQLNLQRTSKQGMTTKLDGKIGKERQNEPPFPQTQTLLAAFSVGERRMPREPRERTNSALLRREKIYTGH